MTEARHDRIALEECHITEAVLTETRRHQCRVQWFSLAGLVKIEAHDKKLATGVECSEFVTISVKFDAFDSGLLGISLRRWGLLVKEPLVQALVSHLAEAPGADQALCVA